MDISACSTERLWPAIARSSRHLNGLMNKTREPTPRSDAQSCESRNRSAPSAHQIAAFPFRTVNKNLEVHASHHADERAVPDRNPEHRRPITKSALPNAQRVAPLDDQRRSIPRYKFRSNTRSHPAQCSTRTLRSRTGRESPLPPPSTLQHRSRHRARPG
jgi:hypothetical protein